MAKKKHHRRQVISDKPPWPTRITEVTLRIQEQSRRCLAAYREDPLLVEEHANIERSTAQGGYGRRQIYELVQNGADALIDHPGGRIHVLLTADCLYCANEGVPVDCEGVDAILSSHISKKRGTEIGRFGLGFKSVLGVTDRPEFYSRSGSFVFNAAESHRRIQEVVPGVERTPVLRLAIPVEANEAAAKDPTLRKLMGWASTVVRLPRDSEETAWLSEDILNFPPEFLLFSDHVGALVLEDAVRNVTRNIKISHAGKTVLLHEDTKTSRWKVFHIDHRPSSGARKDAGELADRESVPVYWAAPLEGARERGTFWAFFPTSYETTLSGIVNAPWKTNEDRQNLLKGPFNDELIGVAAELVVSKLWRLSEELEVGRYLDLMPARGREAPQWADSLLGETVYALAADELSLPNQEGELDYPSNLRLHPNGLPDAAVDAWAAYENRPLDWCHSSVGRRSRWPRAQRLVGEENVATLVEWLEALIADGSAAGSVAALRVVEILLRERPGLLREIRDAKVIMTASGEFKSASGDLFISNERYHFSNELQTVHPEVQTNAEAITVLKELGIGAINLEEDLKLTLGSFAQDGVDWEKFWVVAAGCDSDTVCKIVAGCGIDGHEIHARTLSGDWKAVCEVLMPGRIVGIDTEEDASTCIDTGFHANHVSTLEALGARSEPTPDSGSERERWYGEYRHECLRTYLKQCGGSPGTHLLVFDRKSFPGPLAPVQTLGLEAQGRFASALLALDEELGPWTMYHTNTGAKWPRVPVPNPMVWLLRKHVIPTSLGLVPPETSVGPQLQRWRGLLPVAACSPRAGEAIGLASSLEALAEEQWPAAFGRCEVAADDRQVYDFYASACHATSAPLKIRCRVGDSVEMRSPEEVVVAVSELDYQRLQAETAPAIQVSTESEADDLGRLWGLVPATKAIRSQPVYVAVGEPVPLSDEFPGFTFFVEDIDNYQLVRCEELRVEKNSRGGKTSHDVGIWIDGTTIYWQNMGSDEDLIEQLSGVFNISRDPETVALLMVGRDRQKRLEVLRRVREQVDDVLRFLTAVEPRAIASHLPQGLVESVETMNGALDHEGLARLAFAVYGVDILREFRDELTDRGLTPPTKWSGSRAARRFVEELGFGQEYAGFEPARRDPLLKVDGVPGLPPLHPFQREIADRIAFLLQEEGGKRALLSLPTGAGKTRVTVQAIVEALVAGNLGSPVLWVAQTDELCEQAVQTWREVWRAIGSRDELFISRLWAQNDAEQFGSRHHVVIATIDKLDICRVLPKYDWLGQTPCLVVDEAHGSTTESYTRVLEWCGFGRSQRRDRGCLIGLTATPFRGTSEEETRRLAGRYGRRRLDVDVFKDDPIAELQRLGILSRVRHELIQGSSISLSEDELRHLQKTRLIPTSVGDRLAKDAHRNAALLHSIMSKPDDWTMLVFASGRQAVGLDQAAKAVNQHQGLAGAGGCRYEQVGVRRKADYFELLSG